MGSTWKPFSEGGNNPCNRAWKLVNIREVERGPPCSEKCNKKEYDGVVVGYLNRLYGPLVVFGWWNMVYDEVFEPQGVFDDGNTLDSAA